MDDWDITDRELRPYLLRALYKRCRDVQLAEDAAQEALVKTWHKRWYVGQEVLNARAFAVRCGLNVLLDMQRRARVRGGAVVEGAERVDGRPEPWEACERYEERERVERAVEELPRKERTAVRMWSEGSTLREIAGVLGMNGTAAQRPVKRGLAMVAKRVH